MGLTELVLPFAAPLPRLESFQRYLFFGPHPDDIEIGAGATAAKLASAGKDVRFVICTDGRFGDEYAPAGIKGDKLSELRKRECEQSAAILGINDLVFLNFSDGGLYDQNTLFKAVYNEIGKFKPDVVFAPDPCVSSECHMDHLNVGEAVRRAACFAPYPGICDAYGTSSAPVKALAYYMTAKPNQYIKTNGYLIKQLEAIFDCHLSQFPKGCQHGKAISAYLKLRSIDFGMRKFCTAAEGFRVLGPVHMHCLPEMGK